MNNLVIKVIVSEDDIETIQYYTGRFTSSAPNKNDILWLSDLTNNPPASKEIDIEINIHEKTFSAVKGEEQCPTQIYIQGKGWRNKI